MLSKQITLYTHLLLSSFLSFSFAHAQLRVKSSCTKLNEVVEHQSDFPIVGAVRTLQIPGLKFGYNPSIVHFRGKTLVFFRYDVENIQVESGHKKQKSFVACAEFTNDLNTVLNVTEIALNSFFAEDPRAIVYQDIIYLFYNTPLTDPLVSRFRPGRKMCVAKINPKTLTVIEQKTIHYQQFLTEKNWVPFAGPIGSEEEGIYLIHTLQKFRVLKLDPKDLSHATLICETLEKIPEIHRWDKKWGTARGGSPAILVDGEYWMFFHSFYRPITGGIDIHNYICGAMVFQSTPPFLPKRMLKDPVVFEGMYTSNYRRSNTFTTYPAGVVYEPELDQFLVSIGENDRVMKVLTISKKSLEQALQPIEYEKKFSDLG